MKVSLANPNVALATDSDGKKHKGTWTNVYDEGFEVFACGVMDCIVIAVICPVRCDIRSNLIQLPV